MDFYRIKKIRLINFHNFVDETIEIRSGGHLFMLGDNGSGKTTTLKMINRLIREDAGHIIFFGEDISGMNEVDLRRKIGYVVQQIGLFPHMTVAQNIATVPELLKWDKKEIQARVKELERQRTELENADIISLVRAIDATPEELAALLRTLKNKGVPSDVER